MSFIQQSDSWCDLWSGGTSSHGECKEVFLFSAMSYPFIALYDDGACILRAQENSKLPMQISFIANGINVVLNLVFVWIFHFGVAGSSAATMIARAFAMIAVLYKLKPKYESAA